MMHVQKNNQVLPFSQMGYHIIFLSLSGLPRVTRSVKRKIRSYIVHLGKCHEFKISICPRGICDSLSLIENKGRNLNELGN